MGLIPCDIPMTYYNYFRYLMGEQLDSLNLKELQQLENQLENSLKLIRSRKVKPHKTKCYLTPLRSFKERCYQGGATEEAAAAQPQVRISSSSLLPPWMLSHLNG
ncbi:hypothetical protein BHM03_00016435 [Ensete ventricosum]|nr:hypothetical protein BHM03_00016435 [Ensete ventricosum]